MAGVTETLELQLAKWADMAEGRLDAFCRQFFQEMGLRVVMKTPVDTGFLRGSWQPSIGQPSDREGAPDPTGGAAIGAIAAVLPQVKAGQTLYLTNNAAYARFVEYGTVHMAPRAFVRGALAEAGAVAATVARSLKDSP